MKEQEEWERSGRRMGCSKRRVNVSSGLWDVNEDVLREEHVGSHRDGLLV